MKALEQAIELLYSYKELKSVVERLQFAKDNRTCHIVEFVYADENELSGVVGLGADVDAEFCNLMVDTALKYLQEKLIANEMLLGMAEMALERTMKEGNNNDSNSNQEG